MADIGGTSLFGGYETTRVGRGTGDDGLERLVRTFHINFGSVKCGQSAKGAIDYAFRRGEYKNDPKAAELEFTTGDPDRVERGAELVEASAGRREGPLAERHLVKHVFELPAHANAEQRQAAAEAIVADWEARGHRAAAAIHGNGLVQPHVHVMVTARPVAGDGMVDRSVRLLVGKQAVCDERRRTAGLVNEACAGAGAVERGEVLFHGGRHEDVGINREARKAAGRMLRRLPGRAIRVPGEYDRGDEDKVAEVREKHEAARAASAERAASRQRDRAARDAARVEKELGRARDALSRAEDRLGGIKAPDYAAPEPKTLTDAQRAAMTGALKRQGIGEPDPAANARQQALAFALLNVERERGRVARTRKRAGAGGRGRNGAAGGGARGDRLGGSSRRGPPAGARGRSNPRRGAARPRRCPRSRVHARSLLGPHGRGGYRRAARGRTGQAPAAARGRRQLQEVRGEGRRQDAR